jgi:hypothetical protein
MTDFSTIHLILVLIALLAANLPWFSEKLFYVVPLTAQPKSLGWCLLELVVLFFIVGGISLYAETASMGQTALQNWEFYVITACLFLVFAFPGFVYRYLWKKK